jgi:hypothetical protein
MSASKRTINTARTNNDMGEEDSDASLPKFTPSLLKEGAD